MSELSKKQSAGHRALRKGRASLPQHIYLVTATTVARFPLFADPRAAHAACVCFENPVLLGDAKMLAWVLMPDHAHWLLQLGVKTTLDAVVAGLKAFSARNANRGIGRKGVVWARAYHDRAIRREEDIQAVARYIVANPLRAGLVRRIGEYPYWNAIWL